MNFKLLSVALILSAVSLPPLAAGAEKATRPPPESVTEELKKSGEHLGHATRIAAKKTKRGVKKAAEKVRKSTEKLRNKDDRAR